MSLSRAITSSLRCSVCRVSGLRPSLKTHPGASALHAFWNPSASSQQSISWTARRQVDKNHSATADPELAFLEDDPSTESLSSSFSAASIPAEQSQSQSSSTSAPPEEPQSAPLPWYLQNRPAPTPQQAAIIPALPPNPPPLLQTLLEYVANTAGLDDLLLLDLRHLDPPPALGNKLIMIICTARSEKHLHVSADRFCRYLRREHGLRANAAGLLGRNELKIKLRRKAKRMKMLANVGGVEPEGNIDDGIRTGWICCTVGKIEAHPEDTEIPGAGVEEFVGFRDVKPGVNVVVQMFTEEKRAEIDLESLWNGVLKTHVRQDNHAEEALKMAEEGIDEEDEAIAEMRRLASAPPPSRQFSKLRPMASDVFPPSSHSEPFRQQQLR